MKITLTIIFLFISLQAVNFKARVIGIHDGDSITVLTGENEQMKIRLEGIDCPELKQAYGQRARLATSELCFGKEVRIELKGKDRYGRILAYIYVGKMCVNKELLQQGMAWHFKKYNHDAELADLEVQARKSKLGLWAQKDPVAPWEFRKKKQ